jgi:hypothetical protein
MSSKRSASERQQNSEYYFYAEDKSMSSTIEIEELEQKKLLSPPESCTSINWAIGALHSKNAEDKKKLQTILRSIIKPYENYGDFVNMSGLEQVPDGDRNSVKNIFLSQIKNTVRNGSSFDKRLIKEPVEHMKTYLPIVCDEKKLSQDDCNAIRQGLITDLGNLSNGHQKMSEVKSFQDSERHKQLAQSYLYAKKIMES